MGNSLKDIECYLHENIPLSKSMHVSVRTINDSLVCLAAPLQPNINHRGTVFGGSVSALAMIAGWTLIHVRLLAVAHKTQLVIRRNSLEYLAPLSGDFEAIATPSADCEWDEFLTALESQGKGYMNVTASVECNGESAAHFKGEYIALRD